MKTLETAARDSSFGLSRIDITPEARRFAVRELAKRAGLDPSDCIIGVSDFRTSLFLKGSDGICVHFPNHVQTFHAGLPPVQRCSWGTGVDPSLFRFVPDFVVPFSGAATDDGKPLFMVDQRAVHCSVDLPASVLFSLGRVEEQLSAERDSHGRFPAAASVSVREGYLHRPIVDEYGLGLAAAIQGALPSWKPRARRLRALVTQDVDSVGVPFNLRQTAGRFLRGKQIRPLFQDLGSHLRLSRPAELCAVSYIAQYASAHGITSACFWKSSESGFYDTGYDLRRTPIATVISELRRQGVEMGIHPSYSSFESLTNLEREIELLRDWLQQMRVGGRQHYLRWLPDTWSDLDRCGVVYDSSVGFAERFGFRAGTAFPYRPWLLIENRQARLVELPLILMDRTIAGYWQASPQEVLRQACELISRTEMVGGVFTMLWHNSLILDPAYRRLFETLVRRLASAGRLEWDAELAAA